MKLLKAGKSRKMCLTNPTRSILHHITPLVINGLKGGHTDTHTDAQTKAISRNQACAAFDCAPGLKTEKKIWKT